MRHARFHFTANRRASIRKAQRIRAARQRATPNKSKLRTKSKPKPTRSADTLGKYARAGMRKAADVLTVGAAGTWSGIVEPTPGGRKPWYHKIGKSPKKPPQRKKRKNG